MTPVFSNTAWVRARERLVLRGGRWQSLALRVRMGIIERPEGVVLIDAGYSPEAMSAPGRSLGLRLYARLLAPTLRPEGDPAAALAQLGHRPADVKAVILTHFHVDHVSALARFPQAQIIAHGPSFAALRRNSALANLRHGVFAELLPADADSRLEDITRKPLREAPYGLGEGHDLFGDGSTLAIDLPGHAQGHFGLCFPQKPRPFLYATDTQWLLAALNGRLPGLPASLISEDAQAGAESAARVARFAAQGGEVMLCHDPAPTPRDLDPKA